jgi:hypothetical protein
MLSLMSDALPPGLSPLRTIEGRASSVVVSVGSASGSPPTGGDFDFLNEQKKILLYNQKQ